MSLFPDIIGTRRTRPTPVFTTKADRLGENHRVRYRKSIRPRWLLEYAWELLSPSEAASINAHILSVGGGYSAFDFFDWLPTHWLHVEIGTASGGNLFGLPGKNVDASTLEFFVNTAPYAGAFTIAAGAGVNGIDVVTFAASPPAGTLWMNGTMRRLFNVTFEDDDQPVARLAETGYYQLSTRLRSTK
jgi:hypothetical protein